MPIYIYTAICYNIITEKTNHKTKKEIRQWRITRKLNLFYKYGNKFDKLSNNML